MEDRPSINKIEVQRFEYQIEDVGLEPVLSLPVYEPFLIQRGYIKRTPRGRVATDRAYHHFGLTMTESQAQGQKKLF